VHILTGDIGGTNTRLAMMEYENGRARITENLSFPSPSFSSLDDIITEFFARHPGVQPQAAAFGVAGPVAQGVSRITNLPWVISAEVLAQQLGLQTVQLLNDLEALAWGIDTLPVEDLVGLQTGTADAAGNRAVIAAGTGLGEAGLCFDGKLHIPFATEGGHTDFAPTTERDWRFYGFLQDRFGHVSWERVVSGAGLINLFEFLLQESGTAAPAWFEDPAQDSAACITRDALSGADALCVEALDWFTRLYGAEAGNLALKMKATGGLYLGGGIAPKILPALQDGRFLAAFLDKGRMRRLVEAMPVRVICNEQVSLQGLARVAALRG
jgi:glucokinase